MKGEFIIKQGSALVTYDDYDDIPMEFDNIISFKPDAPEPPHSEEDHKEMETYNNANRYRIKKQIPKISTWKNMEET